MQQRGPIFGVLCRIGGFMTSWLAWARQSEDEDNRHVARNT